jgi:protein phosphatase 1 regulatory subunit 7
LKEKLQELDIDVNNFHLSDFDDGYVTEERLKAILRV